MRVTLIIYSLGPGGAERVVCTMANYWAQLGWRVSILTLDGGESPFYHLHPKVVHQALGIAGVSSTPVERILNNLRRLAVLRRAIRRTSPQVIISFMNRTNVLTLLTVTGMKVPVVVAEVNDPRYESIGRIWERLRLWTYTRADRIVVQSERIKDYYPAAVQKLCTIIPNPIALSEEHGLPMRLSRAKSQRKTALAMGRLVEVKGFDLLLQAFARVAPDHPDWSLVIWGEGALRNSLQALVGELGLCDRVQLPGRTKQPFQKMREAALFVLSSRSEGFGNVLCEAMACGLPVISFDSAGPREIIRDGVDGVLVPATNVEALAEAMDELMSDESRRRRLGARAAEVLERFGAPKVMAVWGETIHEVMGS